jgi:hypothetical protein
MSKKANNVTVVARNFHSKILEDCREKMKSEHAVASFLYVDDIRKKFRVQVRCRLLSSISTCGCVHALSYRMINYDGIQFSVAG